MRWTAVLTLLLCTYAVAGTPLDECNAQRAHYGLPPLVEDARLSEWAQCKAVWQAAHDVSLANGYNGHEGPQLGMGYIEGTGVLDPDAGWGTCAFRVEGSWPAGAGLAIGANGKRYMCLILRISNEQYRERPTVGALSNTSPMSPDPPRVPRTSFTPPRHPRDRWYEPNAYYVKLTADLKRHLGW